MKEKAAKGYQQSVDARCPPKRQPGTTSLPIDDAIWSRARPASLLILVLMAIVTTLMTTPLFEWVYGKKARASGELGTTSS